MRTLFTVSAALTLSFMISSGAQADVAILPDDIKLATSPELSFEKSPLNVELILDNPNPLQFKPFELDDFCKRFDANKICEERWTPKEIAEKAKIDITAGGSQLYSGTLNDYIAQMNKIEEGLNKRGVSLRDSLEVFHYARIPADVERLRKELLGSLGAVTDILPKVKDPLVGDACPLLPIDKLDGLPDAVVQASNGNVVKIKSMGLQINQAQRALCSIGYNLADLGQLFDTSDIEAWKNKLMASDSEKSSLLEKLGISEYADAFNDLDLEAIKGYGTVAKEVYDIVKKGELPGPEQIAKLRNDLNEVLPVEYQIPAIPQIQLPKMPVRTDLKIIKRKVWDTLKFGNPDLASVGASAYIEIRGSEKEQTYAAHGEIGCSVLGNHIPYLVANGYAAIGPSNANLQLNAFLLGQEIFPSVNKNGAINIDMQSEKTYKPKEVTEYKNYFSIGPIPAYVQLRVDIVLGYKYYLIGNNLTLKGGVEPFGSGGVTGTAAIGLQNVLSIGVEGNIKLLELGFPLTGSADVIFLKGRPQLTAQLNSDVNYSILSGRIAAFAEYPDWKKFFTSTKKDYHEIFSFPGMVGTHKIMNYKIVLGATGAKVTGNSVDKADRAEADKFEEIILLDKRKEALAKYETKAAQDEAETWQRIQDDLNSEKNEKVETLSQSIPAFHEQMENNSKALTNSLLEAVGR